MKAGRRGKDGKQVAKKDRDKDENGINSIRYEM